MDVAAKSKDTDKDMDTCRCDAIKEGADSPLPKFPVRNVKDSQLMSRVLTEHMVCIRKSEVAGMGVFATTDLKCGMRLAYYRGEMMTATELGKRYGSGAQAFLYTLEGEGANDVREKYRTMIDGLVPARSNWARFVNSCSGQRNPLTKARLQPNCVFTTNAIIKTRRRIFAGEELFVSYGTEYTKWLRTLQKQNNVEHEHK